ncbi:MAG TPA: rod shape-determining protein MreD [Candidatus Avamphibacillus sp.]|nr:rod shape-determining protein MreD [Candidatus Avamphibacillus sp.]
MRQVYLSLVIFVILVLEGVALELLPAQTFGDLFIISHWVLVCLIYVAIFYDSEETNFSLFYAFFFGLLVDIVYTNILGVYMFTYAITIYIIKKLTRLFQSNLLSTILFGILGITLTDILIYLIFTVIEITELPWQDYIIYRLLPTILANIVFLTVIYPFITKKLIKWKKSR